MSEFQVRPQVGDFFIFPASQRHQVYPFRTADRKGERRSVSFNAEFTSKTEQEALRKQKIAEDLRQKQQDPNYGQFFRPQPVVEKPKSGIMSKVLGFVVFCDLCFYYFLLLCNF